LSSCQRSFRNTGPGHRGLAAVSSVWPGRSRVRVGALGREPGCARGDGRSRDRRGRRVDSCRCATWLVKQDDARPLH